MELSICIYSKDRINDDLLCELDLEPTKHFQSGDVFVVRGHQLLRAHSSWGKDYEILDLNLVDQQIEEITKVIASRSSTFKSIKNTGCTVFLRIALDTEFIGSFGVGGFFGLVRDGLVDDIIFSVA